MLPWDFKRTRHVYANIRLYAFLTGSINWCHHMFTLQHNHAQMGYFLEAKWLYICVMTFRYKIALHVKRTQWTARSCSDGLLWEATLLHVCVMILRYKVLNVKHKAMDTGETDISHSLFSALTTCHLRSSIYQWSVPRGEAFIVGRILLMRPHLLKSQ